MMRRRWHYWLTGVQEVDELVQEWVPEPLVATQTAFEEQELEKRPVIAGYVSTWPLNADEGPR